MGNTCIGRKIHTLNEIELREIWENGTKETITTCNKRGDITLTEYTAIFEEIMTERIGHKLKHKNIPQKRITKTIKHNMRLLKKGVKQHNQ